MNQPAPPMQSPLVGAVLSRKWRVREPIGEGGMGQVFAAENVNDGRRAAVKILRPELVSEPMIRVRFLEEAAACMRLSHVNILRVFEASEAEDGSPYLVMELLDGVPLSAYTKNGERFPPAQAVSILRGVLHGLAAAHAGGVVHRDLKPENVFLARDPSGQFVVKLLDFGVAKVMDVAGGMGQKTKTGMLLGTPAYMSPEQVKNAKEVDPRSDLWSAGVLFFEMLTGRQAFVAATEFARLSLVLGGAPPTLASIDPSLAGWQPLLDRALEKDRARRFQSAAEMEQALASVAMQGAPISQVQSAGPTTAPAGHALVHEPHVRERAAYTPTAASMPAMQPQPAIVVMQAPSAFEATAPSPGGTLSSPSREGIRPSNAPPSVQVVPPASGDLDSRGFRGRPRPRGISPAIVVVLVFLALGAGFAIGFAVGRM